MHQFRMTLAAVALVACSVGATLLIVGKRPTAFRAAPSVVKSSLPSWATLIAGSETPHLIPSGTAGIQVFRSITSLDKVRPDVPISTVRMHLNVNQATAEALIAYMRHALSAEKSFAREQVKARCSRRPELSSLQKLADSITLDDAEIEAYRVELVRRAEDVIGQRAMSALLSYVDDRKKSMSLMVVTQQLKSLEALNQDISELMARACDGN